MLDKNITQLLCVWLTLFRMKAKSVSRKVLFMRSPISADMTNNEITLNGVMGIDG